MATSRKRKPKQSYTGLLICLAVIIAVAVGIIFIFGRKTPMDPVVFSYEHDDATYEGDAVIPMGIIIGGKDVGGMTKTQARGIIESMYEEPENQSVEVVFDEKTVTTSLDRLGVSWGINSAINQAITLGKGGGLIQRYKTQKALSLSPYRIEISKTLDRNEIKDFVQNQAAQIDVEPVDAALSREDGEFVVTAGKNGRKVNVSVTIGRILEAFYNHEKNSTLRVEAAMNEALPGVTTEDVSSIHDLLGAYTTTYRKKDNERTDRCINIEVATANINGKILMPGESVSTSDMMKERIAENGYATGGQYVNGQLEDAIGGGVCQVASTLYNALLRSELQIDRRQNHSLLVSYVDPSFDAAIATGSKDLVFTNNLDNPVFVSGETDGYEVSFRIYGTEYRSSTHSVTYKSVEERRLKSEDIIVEDYDMYIGETKKEGTTHDEVWSHLEMIVYEDGQEVSRTTLHSDYYMPSRAKIHKGMKPKETEPAQTETTAAPESSSAADNG
ncbi:MAG: VanW family protein [Lachnospiraceae bacterium]|nr:VanW family protein [Lachnospiraceae bacterium]